MIIYQSSCTDTTIVRVLGAKECLLCKNLLLTGLLAAILVVFGIAAPVFVEDHVKDGALTAATRAVLPPASEHRHANVDRDDTYEQQRQQQQEQPQLAQGMG